MKNLSTYHVGLLLMCITGMGWLFAGCDGKSGGSDAPLVVFVTGDHEYSSELTMPLIAAELEKNYAMRTLVLKSHPDHNAEEDIPDLEQLQDADLAVFFLRWRRLPAEQLKHIEDYLTSKRPVIGFRTSTHAFNYPVGHPLEKWNAFGELAFNAPPGWEGAANHVHYGHRSSTDVRVIPAARDNPLLMGVDSLFHVRSWLYNVLPQYPVAGSQWLLMGRAVDPEDEAVDNPVAWTGVNSFGGKLFMTTLGHPEDFDVSAVQRLVVNAVHCGLGRPVPETWAGPFAMNVTYDSHE